MRSDRAVNTADLVALFRALSDLSRARIVGLLTERELCVGEIEYLLGLSQTNVSRHLDRLRSAGFVTSRKQAQWVYYRLSSELLTRFPALAELIRGEVARSSESARDLEALRDYARSGMTCSDLPNCRRTKSR